MTMIRCWHCGVERPARGLCKVCGEKPTPPEGQRPEPIPEAAQAGPPRTPVQRLHDEINAARALLGMLPDLLGGDEEAAKDTQVQHDAIEGETSLHEVMTTVVRRIMEVEILVDGIRAGEKRLAARRSRLEAQEANLRAALLVAMDVAQLPKDRMELPFATVSRKSLPDKMEVISEPDIPAEYFVVQDPVLDRAALKAALKTPGSNIPGARMIEGGATIQISTR